MTDLSSPAERRGFIGSMGPVSAGEFRWLLAAGALLLILIVGTIGVRRSTYDSELEEDKNRAATLARLLEEQTLRNFEAVDLVLQAVIDSIATAT